MKKIGLFFGSFNPVHVGHLIIADYMATHTDLDKVWMVVSPHNPLKQRSTLAKDYDRLHLVRLGIGDNPQIIASDVEFNLPKPSYTVDTLAFLKDKYPQYQFVLIMGGDNIGTLHKWKNYEVLLRDFSIYVYNRPDYAPGSLGDHPSVKLFDAPLMELSSTYIRERLKAGQSVRYLVPESVEKYLEETALYK